MWLSLIALKFFLCIIALTNAAFAICDFSKCIYQLTEPLISHFDDLYFDYEEFDYFSDNYDFYADYQPEEEGEKASMKAYIKHESHNVFIGRQNPFRKLGNNRNGVPNRIAFYAWEKSEKERRKHHNNRTANDLKKIKILEQAEALARNTHRIEALEFRKCIMHCKAIDDARQLTVFMMPTYPNLRPRNPLPQPGITVACYFPS
jgi:hypothetical protein